MFGFNLIAGETEVVAEDGSVIRAQWVAAIVPEMSDSERAFRARLLSYGEPMARKLARAHYDRAVAAMRGGR